MCEIWHLDEGWLPLKSSPLLTHKHTQAPPPLHTLSLVGTPALAQQQGQTDCTSQSQQHLSEQSISEENTEKQRIR